jgi:phospholipid/cholesterol/gamma-HCH transport system substrate-binding protein
VTSSRRWSGRWSARGAAGSLAGLVLLAGLSGCGLGEEDVVTVSARFDRAVGVYVNSDVRVLGVKIGKVNSITPDGDDVLVEFQYDADTKVPADAKAVLVAPSIVSDRYVQLTPVWTSGPTLEDGAELGTDRTAVPVELDAIYSSLDQLNRSLGPDGANKDGALSDLIDTGAKNLEGNGELLNAALRDLSLAVGTLSSQRDDFFGTIRNLQDFTTTIAQSDATVRRFTSDLADVSAQLNDQKADLAAAVRALSVALGEVATFVRANSEDLTANVKNLADVTQVLVKQKRAFEEFLDNTPTALSNLQLAYNPESGTLDTRDNNESQGQDNPIGVLCNLLLTVGAPGTDALCASLPSAAPAGTRTGPAPTGVQRDLTLGGILEARR